MTHPRIYIARSRQKPCQQVCEKSTCSGFLAAGQGRKLAENERDGLDPACRKGGYLWRGSCKHGHILTATAPTAKRRKCCFLAARQQRTKQPKTLYLFIFLRQLSSPILAALRRNIPTISLLEMRHATTHATKVSRPRTEKCDRYWTFHGRL